MAQLPHPEEHETGEKMRYRDQEGWRTGYRPEDYGGQDYYEGTRGGRWDAESAWEERSYGAGERKLDEQARRYWARRRAERERGRMMAGGAGPGPYRGGMGGEYPERGQGSPGGYGEMYWGDPYGSQGGVYAPVGRKGAYRAGPYTGRGPKGYRRSDERIRDDVCERLTLEPEVDAEDIEVEVHEGEVFLKGTVMDRYQKRMAEDAIEGVPGVKDIQNQLRIGMGEPGLEKPRSTSRRSQRAGTRRGGGIDAGTSSSTA